MNKTGLVWDVNTLYPKEAGVENIADAIYYHNIQAQLRNDEADALAKMHDIEEWLPEDQWG